MIAMLPAAIAFSPQLSLALITLFLGYILFEVGFFIHYHCHLLPTANQIRTSEPPAPYRDYDDVQDRVKLLIRILDRLSKRLPTQQQIASTDGDRSVRGGADDAASEDVIYKFIVSWFMKKDKDVTYERFSDQFDRATLDVGFCPPPPLMIRMAWSSIGGGYNSTDEGSKYESSTDSLAMLDNESMEFEKYNATGADTKQLNRSNTTTSSSSKDGKLQKENMNEFLSWAFFGVHYSTVQSIPSMQKALERFYTILLSQAGLKFEEGKNHNYVPRCFTFEEVNSFYRPYAVYALVAMMRLTSNCTLYALGFRHYTCKRGLRYWHRAAKPHNREQSPFLFFHGIAPGGIAPYLPMIFLGILRDQSNRRDVFLFENKPISYALCLDALTEIDTVHGVLEAIDRHLDPVAANALTLCGHSFGSCQLTWMVKNLQMKDRIRSLILLDPVSILLSEPDVMINFLYTRPEIESYGDSSGVLGRVIRFLNETKIHVVASSELFIEHYLRRNFAWYNSELWLDDIPRHVRVLVCLAECDEIVNYQKIEKEISHHNWQVGKAIAEDATPSGPTVELVSWKGVGHAHCVSNSEKWKTIWNAMNEMES